jgi:hypothetical protein
LPRVNCGSPRQFGKSERRQSRIVPITQGAEQQFFRVEIFIAITERL